MALLTNKTALMHGTTSSNLAQITAGTGASEEKLCITEYPDLANGQPDQVEITTLCDDAHKYMDGLKNYAEEMAFTCNYSKALYEAVEQIVENQDEDNGDYWGVYFGDTTGTDGKFTFTGKLRLVANGGSNGEVRTMTLYIRPTSDITFA